MARVSDKNPPNIYEETPINEYIEISGNIPISTTYIQTTTSFTILSEVLFLDTVIDMLANLETPLIAVIGTTIYIQYQNPNQRVIRIDDDTPTSILQEGTPIMYQGDYIGTIAPYNHNTAINYGPYVSMALAGGQTWIQVPPYWQPFGSTGGTFIALVDVPDD